MSEGFEISTFDLYSIKPTADLVGARFDSVLPSHLAGLTRRPVESLTESRPA